MSIYQTHFFSKVSMYSFFFLRLSCAEIWKSWVCLIFILVLRFEVCLFLQFCEAKVWRRPCSWSFCGSSSVLSPQLWTGAVWWVRDTPQRWACASPPPSAGEARSPAVSVRSDESRLIKRNTSVNEQDVFVLTWAAVSRGELEREDGALGATLRTAGVCVGLAGAQGWTGLWLPSESLPWELGGVGGICRDSRPDQEHYRSIQITAFCGQIFVIDYYIAVWLSYFFYYSKSFLFSNNNKMKH